MDAETHILQLHDWPETISMGSRRVGLFIILFVQLFLNHAASYPQEPIPKPDHFEENDSENDTGIKQNRGIDHRFGRGSDSTEKGGDEGGSGRRSLQGKASFIPIYAAGAARRRRRQSSSASCLRSSPGLSSMVGAGAATLASLLHFYLIF